MLAGVAAPLGFHQSAEFAASSGIAQHVFPAISSIQVGRLLRFERHEIKPKVAILPSTESERT
jgi:hypothetical protein